MTGQRDTLLRKPINQFVPEDQYYDKKNNRD